MCGIHIARKNKCFKTSNQVSKSREFDFNDRSPWGAAGQWAFYSKSNLQALGDEVPITCQKDFKSQFVN